jgi:hypothetical protein
VNLQVGLPTGDGERTHAGVRALQEVEQPDHAVEGAIGIPDDVQVLWWGILVVHCM